MSGFLQFEPFSLDSPIVHNAGVARTKEPAVRRACRLLITVLTLLLIVSIKPCQAEDPPKPDAVFRVSAFSEAGQIRLHWDIADGHYLYRSRIHVEIPQVDGLRFNPPLLPEGETKSDDYLGKIQVYHRSLDVLLSYSGAVQSTDRVPVTVSYQGCADRGICYPPETKTLSVKLAAERSPAQEHPGLVSAASGASEQGRLFGILAGGHLAGIILVFAGLGLLLAFTPCVLPMIPILSCLIVGSGERTGPWRGLGLSAAYVFSMAAAYGVLGMAAGRFGQNLQAVMQSPPIISAFSILFILFGFSMFGLFDMQLSNALQSKLTKVVNRLPNGRFFSAAAMGFLSALIVGPCVTPPLAGALLYIGQTGDMLTGSLALFALGFGMGIPLLLVGVLGGSILPKAGGWMEEVRAAFGFVLLGVAVWMLSRIIPEPIALGLWGALLLSLGVSLGITPPQSKTSSGMRLRACAAVLAAVYGILLLVGSAAGTHSFLAPLSIFVQRPETSGTGSLRPAFQPLKSVEQLQMVLASSAGRTLVLDFSAEWCESCKQMDQEVFADPRVAAELQRAVLLRSDVTSNDSQDRALMKNLEVSGPPTLLFYGPDGYERRDLRLVGRADADLVLDHLRQAFRSIHESGGQGD